MQHKKIDERNFFERNPKKTILIIIFVGVVVLDILVANALITAGLYTPQRKVEQNYRVENEIYHHGLKSDIAHSDAVWGPMGYKVYTNSMSFKDKQAREVPLHSKKERIIFIGDSFTEGVGYTYEDTFVGQIEKQIDTSRYDILNAGVSSYSPIIYYRKLKHYIEDVGLNIDRVVLFMDISDIQDEALVYTFDDKQNVISQTKSRKKRLEKSFKRFITENTILLSNLRILVRRLKEESPVQRQPKAEDSLNLERALWTVSEDVYAKYGEKGVELAIQRMDMLGKLMSDNDIELAVVVYPWPDQIYHQDLESRQVAVWEKWTKENDAQFVNLFPYFINKENSEKVLGKYFITGDVQWNAAGHKFVAESFLENYNH